MHTNAVSTNPKEIQHIWTTTATTTTFIKIIIHIPHIFLYNCFLLHFVVHVTMAITCCTSDSVKLAIYSCPACITTKLSHIDINRLLRANSRSLWVGRSPHCAQVGIRTMLTIRSWQTLLPCRSESNLCFCHGLWLNKAWLQRGWQLTLLTLHIA